MLTNAFALIVLLASSLAGPFALLGCTNNPTRVAEHSKIAKPQPPVEVRLSFQGSPALGAPLDVTMRVRSLIDAPLITMKWIFPEGVEPDVQPSSWTAFMRSGEIREFHSIVRFPDAKRYVIEGIATIQQEDGSRSAGVDSLVIDLETDKKKPHRSTVAPPTRDLKGVREYKIP